MFRPLWQTPGRSFSTLSRFEPDLEHLPSSPAFSRVLRVEPNEQPTIYISGTGAGNDIGGPAREGTATEETRWSLENLSNLLQEAGSSMDHVVSVSMLLTDKADYNEINEEYVKHFTAGLPSRATALWGVPTTAKVAFSCVALAAPAPPPPTPTPTLAIYQGAYLSQPQARALDQQLFETFDIAQLMELAGLSVACAVQDAFPSTTISSSSSSSTTTTAPTKVIVFAGPGNNGGDGLVAARHLRHFGFQPTVVYPTLGKNTPLFSKLVQQCQDLGITIATQFDENDIGEHQVVLDSVFGFDFQGHRGVCAPYDRMLRCMRDTSVPVVSVDVPSGWDVEQGDLYELGVAQPSAVVSLTAPKAFAQTQLKTGTRHYLGGRFVPPGLARQYGMEGVTELYDGNHQTIELALHVDVCEVH